MGHRYFRYFRFCEWRHVCPQSAKCDASRATTQSDSPGGSTGPGAKSDVYDWLRLTGMSRLTLLTVKHKSENNNFTAAPIRYFSFIVLLKFIAHGCVNAHRQCGHIRSLTKSWEWKGPENPQGPRLSTVTLTTVGRIQLYTFNKCSPVY